MLILPKQKRWVLKSMMSLPPFKPHLGNTYANDFNLFGRTYRVNVQSESTFREGFENYNDVFVKTSEEDAVPISSISTIKRVVGPSIVQKFNMFQTHKFQVNPQQDSVLVKHLKSSNKLLKVCQQAIPSHGQEHRIKKNSLKREETPLLSMRLSLYS